MSESRGATALCHILQEDPELAEAIPPDRRRTALEEVTAREVELPVHGSGTPTGIASGGIGLLVLGGLLIRRVGIEGRFGAELVGEGDLLRPWRDEHDSPLLPIETGWSVVEAARLAVLDESFVPLLGRYPELACPLVARVMQRARSFAVQMAIVHQARVDTRLHMLFWHLAGRWGRVRSDGTALPLRLTHFVLSELVAARRQTVTTALSELARRGLVRTDGSVWLLSGDPPTELRELDPTAGPPSAPSSLAS